MEPEQEVGPIKSEMAPNLVAEQNELLRRNIALNEEILSNTEYIKKYIKWQKIWGVAKVLIILIPLVIGAIYLPPLIKNYINQFTSLY
jgi:hypothetical protein